MRNIPAAIRKPVPTATDSTARGFVVVFIGLQVGMMISGIDGTIVATALPSITRDLGGVSGIAWVVSAYLLFQYPRHDRHRHRSPPTSVLASL